MHLLKNCKQIKVSQRAILSSMSSLCEACQLRKIHKQHFLTTETKTTKVLELVHTDLWGPSLIVSRNGFKYYINFVDDYSRYTWIFSLKLKSEAFEVFKLLKLQLENHFNTIVKMLQSNWGENTEHLLTF